MSPIFPTKYLSSVFVERDLSWLHFNYRVLQEAKDPRVPLYERIKFLAIYSSNLDEYYRVRVASLRQFRKLKKKDRKQLPMKPKRLLKQIRTLVKEQQEEFGHIFRESILPALRSHQIHLIQQSDFDEEQQAFARQFFQNQLKPFLTPQWIDPSGNPPFLENRKLYLAVELGGDEPALAIVRIPSDVEPRFVELPAPEGQHHITFLDELLRFNLDQLFPGESVRSVHAVKISRDAELYIDDEYSGDLVAKIKASLDHREGGLPTRFLYDSKMPKHVLKRLKEAYAMSKYDLIPGARYHNFHDFFSFPNPLKRADFFDRPLPALPHPVLSEAPSLIEAICQKDHILHFPYQDYGIVVQLIEEAASDPATRSIQITLYRVAKESAINRALIQALENGKSVFVFVEVKARFDEETNMHWGDQLKRAGAQVLYSYPGIKVHSKIMQIERFVDQKFTRISFIGTGNFNEKTARLYADHALLTADEAIGSDLHQVFQILKGSRTELEARHLLVSPYTLRQTFMQRMEEEIAWAAQGEEAYMILKMNSLQDPMMIEKLYEASQAGVRIQLIIRGICCLLPGLPGLSENIEIVSIIDRFLEHARIYIFGNGGEELMYIGSADWMTRNLDHRIEVVTPIFQRDIYEELRKLVVLQWSDTQKARRIVEEQSNPYVKAEGRKDQIRSQEAFYDWLEAKEKSQS